MLEQLKKEVFEANMLLPKYGLITFTWGNVKQSREERAYRANSRYVSCKQEESNECEEQAVVNLFQCISVLKENGDKHDGKADVIGNYSEHHYNGESKKNEVEDSSSLGKSVYRH